MQFRSAPAAGVSVPDAQRHAGHVRRNMRSLPAVVAASAGAAPLTASGGGQKQQAAAADVSILSLEELQTTLHQRGLSPEGDRPQLESRLAAFLAHPAAFPEAVCRPHACVRLVGGRLFGGMTPLRRHIQLLLELLQGEELEPGHPDFAFVDALLKMHPRYAEKVSHPPVARFRVRMVEEEDQGRPMRFFEYQDGRGRWDDFSYRKCIGYTANERLTLRDAMRWEVRHQLEAYRRAATGTTHNGRPLHRCDVCGRRVQDGGKLRLVHVQPTFQQLVNDFCEAAGRPPPPVDGKVPGTNRGCFTDEAWAADWQRYHRNHVRQLRLECTACAKARADAFAAGTRAGSGGATRALGEGEER